MSTGSIEAGKKKVKPEAKPERVGIPGYNGRGTIYPGSPGGNKPGSGVPKSEVRQRAREIGYAALESLAADIEALSPADRARLGELGMKYGMGEAAAEAVADAEVVSRIFQYLKEERGIDPGELADYEAWAKDRF